MKKNLPRLTEDQSGRLWAAAGQYLHKTKIYDPENWNDEDSRAVAYLAGPDLVELFNAGPFIIRRLVVNMNTERKKARKKEKARRKRERRLLAAREETKKE